MREVIFFPSGDGEGDFNRVILSTTEVDKKTSNNFSLKERFSHQGPHDSRCSVSDRSLDFRYRDAFPNSSQTPQSSRFHDGA